MKNQKQSKYALLSFFVGVAALVLSGCASHRPTGTHQRQTEREALVTVEAVDAPARLVTVRGASGETLTVCVDESVKSFPQAKVGDRVRIRYLESFALRLQKPGEPDIGLEVTDETTRPGTGRPTGSATTEVKATVRIESVDRKRAVVTFTGPRGLRTVQILDSAMQDYVKRLRPGDKVEVTYKEALALSLEPV